MLVNETICTWFLLHGNQLIDTASLGMQQSQSQLVNWVPKPTYPQATLKMVAHPVVRKSI